MYLFNIHLCNALYNAYYYIYLAIFSYIFYENVMEISYYIFGKAKNSHLNSNELLYVYNII